jgi:hypothetical protein
LQQYVCSAKKINELFFSLTTQYPILNTNLPNTNLPNTIF